MKKCAPESIGVISVVLLLLLTSIPHAALLCQELPRGATPRGVVWAFLTRTSSPADSVDRSAFSPRLSGELARRTAASFEGMIPAGTRVTIDSIPDLADGPGGEHRVVALVTLEQSEISRQLSIFCVGDSIWRLEAIREFPTTLERALLKQTLAATDTTTSTERLLRNDLRHLLLPDDSLRALFRHYAEAVSLTVPTIAAHGEWHRFSLRQEDLYASDEYHVLDDDVAPEERVFYVANRAALDSLAHGLGVHRFERLTNRPEAILLVAGAIGDGSYGYLHVPRPAVLPPLSENGFIEIRPIRDQWYLYRSVAGGGSEEATEGTRGEEPDR